MNDDDLPPGPPARKNRGYGDRLAHRNWHFIDLAFVQDSVPDAVPDSVSAPPAGRTMPGRTAGWMRGATMKNKLAAANVRTQIAAFRKALGAPNVSIEDKSYDLVWLLHLVGDAHQPLHCASRFDGAQPAGDRGGNTVRLCAPPCTDVLHGLWDAATGNSPDPADALAQAAALATADPALAGLPDETSWIAESFAAVGRSVYIPPIGAGTGPFTIDDQYQNQARRVALERIALAGARLARLINHELDKPGRPGE